MTKQEAKELLERVENGTCTPEEKILVDSWYLDITRQAKDFTGAIDYESEKLWIWNQLQKRKVRRLPNWLVAAACLTFFMLSIGVYVFVSQKHSHPAAELASKDILPGTNKATLTLANGKRIDLDAAKNGNIASLTGVTVQKTASGKVIYHITSGNDVSANAETLAYNTISTPNGGQYEVILPDGTDVYLNAASSLIYPTRFAGNERLVTLSGEAYFEVSKDPSKPFIIKSTNVAGSTVPQQLIKVLGTHFNVSCYPEEPIKTTLAEGKIEISQPANPQKATLKPGNQSIVSSNGIKVQQVNVEAATAWKDGLFVFSNTDLQTVLKQISRWYDVEVDQSITEDQSFEGEIPRNVSLYKVLEAIEIGSHVKLKVKGRRIVYQ
jgi:ferric-dicitrate binding protein FerR (iron transport regulator)